MTRPIGQGDTVLITGGGSGIGRGMAQALHRRGAQVIVAGRSVAALGAVASAHPGIQVEQVDVADPASVDALAARIAARHPGLNVLVNNAGLQQELDFRSPVDPRLIAREIDTNLTGLVTMTAAFLPLLRQQDKARIVQVGSGLGLMPLAAVPVYSATKAAVHSFCISLRWQLRGTGVQVVEIISPVVETALHRHQSRRPPKAMPLDTFVTQTLAGLDRGRDEVAVGVARVLRLGVRLAPGLFLRILNTPR